MQRFEPVGRARWVWGAYAAVTAMLTGARGFEIEVEGLTPGLLEAPLLIVTNHTHRLDWLPLHHTLFHQQRQELAAWIKLDTFHKHPFQGFILSRTGQVPLASRGYIIDADHHDLFGRAPTVDERRALRAHVNRGAPLPDDAWGEAVRAMPRTMAGWGFEPSIWTYRQAIHRTYEQMMAVTLSLARRAMRAGQRMHIYPEGAISARLQRGRHGALQAALALGLDILPVGVNGMRRAFGGGVWPGPDTRIGIRFGEPWRVPRERYKDFVAFRSRDERAWRDALTEDTDAFMRRLGALLDADCCAAPARVSAEQPRERSPL